MRCDPQKLYISSCSPLARNPLDDYIGAALEERMTDSLRYFTYTTNDVLSTRDILPADAIKKFLKPKKETEKMEAKKCDRCGKLYEMPGADESEGAEVRFKFIKVPYAEEKSEAKIAEAQRRLIYIHTTYKIDRSTCIDLCPECRESLKKWFEEA